MNWNFILLNITVFHRKWVCPISGDKLVCAQKGSPYKLMNWVTTNTWNNNMPQQIVLPRRVRSLQIITPKKVSLHSSMNNYAGYRPTLKKSGRAYVTVVTWIKHVSYVYYSRAPYSYRLSLCEKITLPSIIEMSENSGDLAAKWKQMPELSWWFDRETQHWRQQNRFRL